MAKSWNNTLAQSLYVLAQHSAEERHDNDMSVVEVPPAAEVSLVTKSEAGFDLFGKKDADGELFSLTSPEFLEIVANWNLLRSQHGLPKMLGPMIKDGERVSKADDTNIVYIKNDYIEAIRKVKSEKMGAGGGWYTPTPPPRSASTPGQVPAPMGMGVPAAPKPSSAPEPLPTFTPVPLAPLTGRPPPTQPMAYGAIPSPTTVPVYGVAPPPRSGMPPQAPTSPRVVMGRLPPAPTAYGSMPARGTPQPQVGTYRTTASADASAAVGDGSTPQTVDSARLLEAIRKLLAEDDNVGTTSAPAPV